MRTYSETRNRALAISCRDLCLLMRARLKHRPDATSSFAVASQWLSAPVNSPLKSRQLAEVSTQSFAFS